jgi:hypothetical protein
MPFSEKVKLEAKRMSAFRCIICQEPFVEVHHIIPQEEGGTDTIENAAPLCSRCHDLFGDNASKRKQIRQMRESWFETVERKQLKEHDSYEPFCSNPDNLNALRNKAIAIYHTVFEGDSFAAAARTLFCLISTAQKSMPNQKRVLYLDIEGHRNKAGGFDADMLELQKDFILGFLLPFLTVVHMPLMSAENKKMQDNNIPEELAVFREDK